MQIFAYLAVSAISIFASFVIAYEWAWDWFGHLFHTPLISKLWFIPGAVILLFNILFITYSPRFIEGWHFSWWHYAVLLAGWAIGLGALLLLLMILK